MEESDYLKYRGKCKELCEAAIVSDSTLKLVRGHYFDPIRNTDEEHWWTVKQDGTIYDTSIKQFPSKGSGIYTEFDGKVACSECGKIILEENMIMQGRYPVCSDRCALSLVGLL